MNSELVKEKIINAYQRLVSRDVHLFAVDANERSFTHKLAEYLQDEFENWNVDCEYNRNGFDVKKLEHFKKTIYPDDTDAVTVYPDIIIHHRGTKNNLVVIEAKKSNFSGEDVDDRKLRAYKSQLCYKHAYKVTFPIGSMFDGVGDISCFIVEIL